MLSLAALRTPCRDKRIVPEAGAWLLPLASHREVASLSGRDTLVSKIPLETGLELYLTEDDWLALLLKSDHELVPVGHISRDFKTPSKSFSVKPDMGEPSQAPSLRYAVIDSLRKTSRYEPAVSRALALFSAQVEETERLLAGAETLLLGDRLALCVVVSPVFRLVLNLYLDPWFEVIDHLTAKPRHTGIQAVDVTGALRLGFDGKPHATLASCLRDLATMAAEPSSLSDSVDRPLLSIFARASAHARLAWIAALQETVARLESGEDLRPSGWSAAGNPWGSHWLAPALASSAIRS